MILLKYLPCFFLISALCLVGCVSEAPEPGEADTAGVVEPEARWTPEISWDIQTTPGTYDMPESIVFLIVDGVRIPVGDGPGLQEMTDEQRARFRVPAKAEWAAAGYFAGFGVNMIAEIKNDSILVSRTIWDEQADPALAWNYQLQAGVALKDIQLFNAADHSSQTSCFEGLNGTTTSEFRYQVEEGRVSAEHNRTIADHDMGYFTSAQSKGEGVLVGNAIYVSLVTQIEYDVQKAVEIWTLAPDGLMYDSFIYSPCAD